MLDTKANMHNCMHSTQMSTAQNTQTQDGNPTAPDRGESSIIRELAQLNNHLSRVLGSILIAPCDGMDFQIFEYEEAVLAIKNLTELMHIGATALPNGETIVCENEQACHLMEHHAGVASRKSVATSEEKEPTIPGDQSFNSPQPPDEGPSTGQAAEDHVGNETILPETGNRDVLIATSHEISINTVQRNSEKLNPGKTSLLLDIPYDVRRVIYSFYYPVNQNIQLTDGPPEWNTLIPRRGACFIFAEGLNLPLTCRQLNDEIVRLIYGTNNFLLAPGDVDFPMPKASSQPRANTGLFLPNLRLQTKQTVRCLQLCLGPALRWKLINKLVHGLSGISRVVITVDPLNIAVLKPAMKAQQRRCVREACRKIAVARSVLPLQHTLWDDCGDAATGRMLDSVLPNGYCRAT